MTSQDYLNLITSEHNLPSFEAAVTALVGGPADQINLLASMPGLYDLDVAVGTQLDAVGKWIGVGRQVAVPLVGVYFSLDTAGVGFDAGSWFGPGDSTTGLVNLDDVAYRLLLRSQVAANHWDGSMASLLDLLTSIFVGTGSLVFIVDNQDMSMTVGVAGVIPPATQKAMLTNGLLIPKPEGVHVNYSITSVPGAPLFGFDIETATISGFDVGAFGI